MGIALLSAAAAAVEPIDSTKTTSTTTTAVELPPVNVPANRPNANFGVIRKSKFSAPWRENQISWG
ncbi:hypothetical protein TYRP_018224 [Tyrophagus putrescentiae]|nr:hypothetical protein TYRP_018224 [Tyrophagus putrescentiae]